MWTAKQKNTLGQTADPQRRSTTPRSKEEQGGGDSRDARLDSSKAGQDRASSRAKVEGRLYGFTDDGAAADSSGPAEAAWTAAEDSNLAVVSGTDPAPDQGEQSVADPPLSVPERKQVPRRIYFMGPDAMSQAQ